MQAVTDIQMRSILAKLALLFFKMKTTLVYADEGETLLLGQKDEAKRICVTQW